ncbi:Pectinesterase inhibitor domain containing protein [Parasponia andersonii]|uniref:Pectinesterase n=1 Tax=Parasponia andersonii TaxID=3476 RepID=A0A2P5B342_PARAD|nr:Pectinesterase inhibitor domain containing protein [Parasponia andersonii]
MVGKVVVSGISIILVVGVALAVVAVVHHNDKKGETSGVGVSSHTMTSKVVESICTTTDYKAACRDSLSPVAKNSSADYKDYIKAAMLTTVAQVSKSLNLTESLLVEANTSDPRLKISLEDCNDLLSLAVGQLQASFSMVGDHDLHTLQDRSDELKSWLSSVITYAETCIDGIPEPKIQSKLEDNIRNATALTDNALAIVSGLSQILEAFGLKINAKPLSGGRRLLSKDGFPTWLSASDRKLLQVNNGKIVPNAVVAKDGSGQFNTIAAALAAYPKNLNGTRYVIYVKAGVYNEYITVEKKMVNVLMYGDGPKATVVTGSKSFTGGLSTFRTASFSVIGAGFICKNMGFANTAGPEGHQAVALRVQSEMSAFYNCRMDGYQDTLYVQAGRQFYRNCVISGTIDFIFGDGTVVIQDSLLIVRRPMDNQINAVTAQGRKESHQPSGIVIQNCRILPEQQLFPDRLTIKTYLGRPWKEFSRTVIMESTLEDFIQPAGWFPWAGNFGLDTLYFAEYANVGAGARTDQRVKWKGYRVLDRNQALQFTAGPFLGGDKWLSSTGVVYDLGFKR